jgi:hypothetical protein
VFLVLKDLKEQLDHRAQLDLKELKELKVAEEVLTIPLVLLPLMQTPDRVNLDLTMQLLVRLD